MNFPAEIQAARKALQTAELHVKPLDPELAAMLQARYPEKFAEAERKVAEISATIPALRARFEELDARACGKCGGTGEYRAPTSHFVKGRPVCFRCGGHGER
jgi:hypothetical protein